jgi:hypothetical protein
LWLICPCGKREDKAKRGARFVFLDKMSQHSDEEGGFAGDLFGVRKLDE